MKKFICNLGHMITKPIIFRLFTAPFRLLPDFLIIGGMRCGTTSLYYNLIKHPNVVPVTRKEIHFFGWHYQRGINWYRAHFPLALWKKLKERKGQPFITGEATPRYFFDIHALFHITFYICRAAKVFVGTNQLSNGFFAKFNIYCHDIYRVINTGKLCKTDIANRINVTRYI